VLDPAVWFETRQAVTHLPAARSSDSPRHPMLSGIAPVLPPIGRLMVEAV